MEIFYTRGRYKIYKIDSSLVVKGHGVVLGRWGHRIVENDFEGDPEKFLQFAINSKLSKFRRKEEKLDKTLTSLRLKIEKLAA